MTTAKCKYHPDCSAPICPEDPESLAHCAFFCDEEICKRADYAGLSWIKRQKRIARATQKDFWRGCFTMTMLSTDCRVSKGIRGLDPETEITAERVKKWLKEHPAITASDRARLQAQGQKIEGKGRRFGSQTGQNIPIPEPSAPETVKSYGKADEGGESA